ncbi:DUF2252 domain-containing protein [Flavobacterium subsaxonicum]|uniref:DUF2252 domain-containing protein n=1 Tax=Flavobacterium subsaxonicum WB 4.1-42 = DSM 21790 TaxID=1121898 RepID=A0A0A2N2J0_9FLAO|nr:DUF2252 domain-containing protein [Flavobacterium subsaxonicum]KGO94645.1 hypothetical protein Q766_00535 [Flavobacterium subsaxonicum WB 4.1-42 = DSM 21790]
MKTTSKNTLTKHFAASASKLKRYEYGRLQTKRCPIELHGLHNTTDRPDPIAILAQNSAGRIESLLPIRYQRMAESPLAFYRGSAAIMASDLGRMPSTRMNLQACGDCHLQNFGGFATPERRLVFDIDDFDETAPAPWEWDVKRLAASFMIAGKTLGFSDIESQEAAWRAANSYRIHMAEYAKMSALQIWYAQISLKELTKDGYEREKMVSLKKVRKAASLLPHEREFEKLTYTKGGRHRIKDNPPLIYHVSPDREAEFFGRAERAFYSYLKTLSPDKRILLNRYTIQDVAIKVVGVGSVGTWCGVILLMSATGDPLFLQFKEAHNSILEQFTGIRRFKNHGQRVVQGQKLMQSASDMFLGFTTDDEGRSFYIRQMRDAKVKPVIEKMGNATFLAYARSCGWALARAHARTGDAAILEGYMGSTEMFEDAIAKYAVAYNEQNNKDYDLLLNALKNGTLS